MNAPHAHDFSPQAIARRQELLALEAVSAELGGIDAAVIAATIAGIAGAASVGDDPSDFGPGALWLVAHDIRGSGGIKRRGSKGAKS